jgi:hypothetical protein
VILKLDPRWPLVWRTPQSAQVGIDPPKAVLDNLTVTQEHMLAALVVGISEPGMTLFREHTPGERARLLHALAPALMEARPDHVTPTIAISGGGLLVTALAELLGRSGIRVLLASDDRSLEATTPCLAVIVGTWVLAPDIHNRWLRRDIQHLPIVFSDTGVTVGPLVTPGDGACLRCLELYRTDADGAWPAIASQLTGLGGGAECAILAAEAAPVAARMVLSAIEGSAGPSASVHIDAQKGERVTTNWEQHPACGCGGIDRLLT